MVHSSVWVFGALASSFKNADTSALDFRVLHGGEHKTFIPSIYPFHEATKYLKTEITAIVASSDLLLTPSA